MTLQVRDLHVSYPTASVLNGVSFEVGKAQSLALLGRNGMGKTTLVRALTGLRQPSITQGEIRYEGKDITQAPSFRRSRAGIALVPQGRRVFGSLTTQENLTVISRKAAAGQSQWTLERVYEFFPRLAERRRSMASQLSGGEQQMLAIGRALMVNPTLLIMDEPSEGLAPSVLDVIVDRVRELVKTGLTVVIAEQHVDMALELSESVVILDDTGGVAWSGGSTELREQPQVLDQHLGV